MVKRFTKWFSKTKQSNHEEDNLDDKVNKAKNGNEQIRELLLEQYKPFIKKCCSKASGKYITDSMDEYSVGLLAFNEAINQFNSEQGHFLTFANVVIQRRIIDYKRKEKREKQYIHHYQDLISDGEEQEESFIEQKKSLEIYEQEREQASRVEEIKEYQLMLSSYNITFSMLTEQCPKHVDARENAKRIAKLISEDPECSTYLFEKKRLPVKKIEERVQCSRKTIERNRNYIIAMALIYIGGFTSLQSYIAPEKGGE